MEDSRLFDLLDLPPGRRPVPPDKHLCSPITISLLRRVLGAYDFALSKSQVQRKTSRPNLPTDAADIIAQEARKNLKYRYSGLSEIVRPFLQSMAGCARRPVILEPSCYPEYLKKKHPSAGIAEVLEPLKRAGRLYCDELKAIDEWDSRSILSGLTGGERVFVDSVRVGAETVESFTSYRYWDAVVEHYRVRQRDKRWDAPLRIGATRYRFFNGFVLEEPAELETRIVGDTTTLISPVRTLIMFEQLQMLQDACLARFNVYLALDCGVHNGPSDLRKQVTEILAWQEDALIRYGNLGYDLVKGPESVYKARLTQLSMGDVLPISSFDRTLSKMRVKERKLSGTQLTPSVDALQALVLEYNSLTSATELFGLTKLSGHPYVEAEASARSVKEEALPLGTADHLAIADMTRYFKHMILESYLKKHQVWPPFKKHPIPGSSLDKLYRANATRISDDQYALKDWDHVSFGKFMEFDYSPDYLGLMDDKAISPGASEVHKFWTGGNRAESRRLLETLLKRPDIDTVALVERLRRGKFTHDERIVELTQKEREFKIAARCFAKLTFEVRLFYIITELNLKRFAGGATGSNGYLPQQTMTMSSTEIKKRMYSLTKHTSLDNHCLVELDFSRWNLKWRSWTVNPIGEVLGDIFDMRGAFTQAHWFFQSCTVVLTDKHSIPDGADPSIPIHKWPESDLLWRKHQGGFEGICQTLWTICTIAMIRWALFDQNVSFLTAGMGDNHIFSFSFRLKKRSLDSALQELLDVVETRCRWLNHEVKPEECVDSRTVLTYGKEIYISGVHYQYVLKFASRAFERTDLSIPSLTKEIASVMASAMSVATSLHNTLRANYWKNLQLCLLLARRLKGKTNLLEHRHLSMLTSSIKREKLLLLPGSVGGLPVQPWTKFFSRGETDDLSFDLAAVFYLSRNLPVLHGYMHLLLHGEFKPDTIDPGNLMNDPHSIPIDRPNDASHLVASGVAAALPSLVANRNLANIISTSVGATGEAFKKALSTMSPLMPQIAADIVAISPAGLRESVIKRFTKTRTIEMVTGGTDVSSQVTEANNLLISVLTRRWTVSSKCSPKPLPRPFAMGNVLRQQWGLDLVNSSIGVYTPFDFPLIIPDQNTANISASCDPNADILGTAGRLPPNFGTTTKMKIDSHGYQLSASGSTLSDIKKAFLILSELSDDPSLRRLVNSIVEARTPWTYSSLVGVFPTVFGGVGPHRHAGSSHRFGLLGSSSVPTHITLSSDNSGILAGGKDDYPVAFQTLYLTLTSIFQGLAALGLRRPPALGFGIPDSLDTIDTRPVTIPSGLPTPKWPLLRGNKLAYVDRLLATEVPHVPDPTLIHHVPGSATDHLSLFYSYNEVVLSALNATRELWETISDPTDVYDFGEVSKVDPYLVERALSWNVLTDAIFETASFQGGPPAWGTALKKALVRAANAYAGQWVRMRLHPMFRSSTYNVERGIAPNPGAFGYRSPVNKLANRMIAKVLGNLHGNNITGLPKLLLFSNWKKDLKRLTLRRTMVSWALIGFPRITPHQVLQYSMLQQPPSELLSAQPAVYIHSALSTKSRRITGRPELFVTPPVEYISASPELAMRGLRLLTPYSDSPAQRAISAVTIAHHGVVKYTRTGRTGRSDVDWTTRPELCNTDRYRTLRSRCAGKTSPLYSLWSIALDLILSNRGTLDSTVHVFGVGRGALVRALNDRIRRVIGYDLRSMIPELSQRSASFIPPEVSLNHKKDMFQWSTHHQSTSGDILEGSLDICDTAGACIIDMDVTGDVLLQVLARVPIGRVVAARFKGSETQCQGVISAMGPDKVYCLSKNRDHSMDLLLYCVRWKGLSACIPEDIQFDRTDECIARIHLDETGYQLWDIDPVLSGILGFEPFDELPTIGQMVREFAASTDPSHNERRKTVRLMTEVAQGRLDPELLTRSDLRYAAAMARAIERTET